MTRCPGCQGEILEADIHAMHGCALCRECEGLFKLPPPEVEADDTPERIIAIERRLRIERDEIENRLLVREPPNYGFASIASLAASAVQVWTGISLSRVPLWQGQFDLFAVLGIAIILLGLATAVIPFVRSWMVWREFEFGPAGMRYRLLGAWHYVKNYPRELIWEVVPLDKNETAGPAWLAILRCGKIEYEIRCAAKGERNKLIATINDYLKKSSPGRYICPECARSVPWASNEFEADRESYCPWCNSIYLPSEAKLAGEAEEREAAALGLPIRPPLSPIKVECDEDDSPLRLRFSKWGIVKPNVTIRKKIMLLLCPMLICGAIAVAFLIDDIFGAIFSGSLCLVFLAVWMQVYAEFGKRLESLELDSSHLRLVSLHCGLFRRVSEYPRVLPGKKGATEEATLGVYEEKLHYFPVVVNLGGSELSIPAHGLEEQKWLVTVLNRRLQPTDVDQARSIFRPHCPKCQIPVDVAGIDWNILEQMRRETGKTLLLCRECGETFRFKPG